MAVGSVVVNVVPYDRALVRQSSGFSCGHPALDDWLTHYAGQNQRRNNTRTFLGIIDADGPVVGYYSTCTAIIEPDDEARRYGVGQRDYPIPAVLLARLAVDRKWQGCGVGQQLLAHALRTVLAANEFVGFEVLVVDAIDEAAETFYGKHGFIRFHEAKGRLFLPIKQIRASLPSR